MTWAIDAPIESLDALGLAHAHPDEALVSTKEKEVVPA
jgi:hypothetical protein